MILTDINRLVGDSDDKNKAFYVAVITDPDDALTVANTCLHKHFIYDFVRTWLGNGLLTSSGKFMSSCHVIS